MNTDRELTQQTEAGDGEHRLYLDNLRRERELTHGHAMTAAEWDRMHLIAVGFAATHPYSMPTKGKKK